jgi:hypothetical protein
VAHCLGTNADAVFAAERLAAELEQNPGKFWLFDHRHKTGSARGIKETFNSRRTTRQIKAAAKIKKERIQAPAPTTMFVLNWIAIPGSADVPSAGWNYQLQRSEPAGRQRSQEVEEWQRCVEVHPIKKRRPRGRPGNGI